MGICEVEQGQQSPKSRLCVVGPPQIHSSLLFAARSAQKMANQGQDRLSPSLANLKDKEICSPATS